MQTFFLQAPAQGGGSGGFLIMMVGMFVIMYFFMIRPQMKRMKEAKKYQQNLAIGDKVMTLGGIHGEVLEIGDTDVVIKIDQGRLRIEKSGLSHDRKMADANQSK